MDKSGSIGNGRYVCPDGLYSLTGVSGCVGQDKSSSSSDGGRFKCADGMYSMTGQLGCLTKCSDGGYVPKGKTCAGGAAA